MEDEIKIEHGISYENALKNVSEDKFVIVFSKMQPGDSFWVAGKDRYRVLQARTKINALSGMNIVHEPENNGYRFWRV